VNLVNVDLFTVSNTVITETERALREAGQKGYELFVLWSGAIEDDLFVTRSWHVPVQTSYRLDSGLCVRVEGAALHDLNMWLFGHSEKLAVQIHTHPGEAYHSETDDSFPVVTERGGLSLVVPDFCRSGLLGPGHMTYRLGDGGWDPQPAGLIQVV
jgi:hypothetical protein